MVQVPLADLLAYSSLLACVRLELSGYDTPLVPKLLHHLSKKLCRRVQEGSAVLQSQMMAGALELFPPRSRNYSVMHEAITVGYRVCRRHPP